MITEASLQQMSKDDLIAMLIKPKQKRQPKRLPKIISREDAARILSMPNINCITGLRARVILQVLYRAGLRVEEVCSLAPSDFIPPGTGEETGFIFVRQGKGSKDRQVVIDAETVGWLNLWLDNLIPGDYLFCSVNGNKMNQSQIRKIVYLYAEKAGVFLPNGSKKARVHPHTLRACYATERLEEGKNPIYIQEQLGHASFATTRVYLEIRPSLRRHVAEDIPPVGGLPV